jgi:hypothetical protein
MGKLRGFTVVVVVLTWVTIAASASASPPVNNAPPEIVAPSQLRPGAALQATGAAWGGDDIVSYSYQWLECDANGQACAPIAGATGGSYYRLTDSDVGHTLRFQETAYAQDGASASGISNSTAVVVPYPPTNTVRPVITGQHAVGAVLTETPGTWSSTAPVSFSYQWYSCRFIHVPGKPGQPGYFTFAPCQPIAGATKPNYTIANADKPGDLYAWVTATNAGGSTMASPASAAVVGPTSYLGSGPGGPDPLWALPRNIPSVPWMLSRGGMTGSWKAPRAGHLDITWTATLNGKSVLVAKAHATFRRRGRYKVTTRLTKRGRAEFARNYLLAVYITSMFTPAGERAPTITATSLTAVTF